MSAVEPGRLPGCGIAAFVGVLFVIFSLGVTGIVFSWYSMLTSGGELAPQKVSYGGVIDARMLKPMREAGLLGANEIPDLFHAENIGGTEACAVSSGKLLRLDAEDGAQSLPLASVTSVTGDETQVTVTGEITITCPFRPGEGAEKFRRMLEHR
ncbi:MAG: hypothetical protein ACK4YP_00170 [Myxococcota bacterium]